MSNDVESRQRSRVVIDTPSERREFARTENVVMPERGGISAGTVAALVISAVALVTILFLFLMNRQSADEVTPNTVATGSSTTTSTTTSTPLQQPPMVVQQPAQTTSQPPIIIQQPAPATTQPIVVPAPPSTGDTTTSKPAGLDDSTIQSNIDKRISADSTLSSAGVIAVVIDGKVTLTGIVDSASQKQKAEQMIRSIKGVKAVDNKITVTPSPTGSSSPEE